MYNIDQLNRIYPDIKELPVFTIKALFRPGTKYLCDEDGNKFIIENHINYIRSNRYKYYMLRRYNKNFIILQVFTDNSEPYRLNNIITIQKVKVITLKV